MTAIRKKIGHIILSGGTTSDIKKEVPCFPVEPSFEFFEMLGYKQSIAKKYLQKLNQNNCAEKNRLITEGFIFSQNADLTNLLVDTSAIGNEACTTLIYKASQVTILLQTVVEMDNVRSKNKKMPLSSKILDFTRNILKNPDKYEIASFSTNSKQYVDDAIIDYLKDITKSTRPTIITADANLCLKAKCYGLEYIYYINPCPTADSSTISSKDSSKPRKVINIGHGLLFCKIKKNYYIESNGSFSFQLIRKKKKYTYLLGVDTKIPVEQTDVIKVFSDKEYVYQIKHLLKKINK